jgi:hypothetical protein
MVQLNKLFWNTGVVGWLYFLSMGIKKKIMYIITSYHFP